MWRISLCGSVWVNGSRTGSLDALSFSKRFLARCHSLETMLRAVGKLTLFIAASVLSALGKAINAGNEPLAMTVGLAQ